MSALMRRAGILGVLLCLGGIVFARPPIDTDSPFRAEMSVQTNISFARPPGGTLDIQPAFSSNPSVVWRPGLLGVGLNVKTFVSTRYLNLTTAPQIRGEIWWFTISAGWAFRLVGGDPDTSRSAGAIVSLGLSPDFLPFAWGTLGLDATVDLIIPQGAGSTTTVFSSWGWTGWFGNVAGALLTNPAVGLGLTYSFPL